MSVLAVGMSRPGFDDGRGKQHVVFPVVERRHDVLELGRRQPAMRHRELHFRHLGAEELRHVLEIGDARHDIEALAAAIVLAQQRSRMITGSKGEM